MDDAHELLQPPPPSIWKSLITTYGSCASWRGVSRTVRGRDAAAGVQYVPVLHYNGDRYSARQLVACDAGLVAPGARVRIAMTCGMSNCVNAEHMAVTQIFAPRRTHVPPKRVYDDYNDDTTASESVASPSPVPKRGRWTKLDADAYHVPSSPSWTDDSHAT